MSAIGCDGTVVNTGRKSGTIHLIEELLKGPVQWLICQLHSNELPLRHLFQLLDGKTAGPSEISGVKGKLLKSCTDLPIVKYRSIRTELPEITSDLSSDQKYLFDICKAISEGPCNPSIANRNPGHISQSRWVTTANRILRRVQISPFWPLI